MSGAAGWTEQLEEQRLLHHHSSVSNKEREGHLNHGRSLAMTADGIDDLESSGVGHCATGGGSGTTTRRGDKADHSALLSRWSADRPLVGVLLLLIVAMLVVLLIAVSTLYHVVSSDVYLSTAILSSCRAIAGFNSTGGELVAYIGSPPRPSTALLSSPSLLQSPVRDSNAPTVDFFVRTWRGDGHWLVFLLRSIDRFVPRTMYRRVIICFSHLELAFFESYLHAFSLSLHLQLAPVVDQDTNIVGPNNGGYSSQMVSKFYAFNHSDADFFIHMDSDTIFNRPVTLLDFLDSQRRVYVSTVEYASLQQNFGIWQTAAEQLLKEPVPKETMTSFPFVYPRSLYPTTIALVEKAHAKPFIDATRNCTRIIEFTTLGHVLITRFPDQWLEKPIQERSDMVYQSWSWGGFSPEIVAWYECVLQSGKREECKLIKPPPSDEAK